MNWLTRKIDAWRFERQLDRNLEARRTLRAQRREAALKGWETRRA